MRRAGTSSPLTQVTPTRFRLFSAERDQPRFRRATDVFLFVPALLGLALLVAAYPPSRFERSLIALLDSFPGPLDPIWAALYDMLAIWALVLVGVAIVARRHAVWLAALASVAVAVAVTLGSARLAFGHWPDLSDNLRLRVDDTTFPALRVAMCAAVILAVAPHLTRSVQRFGRWLLVLGTVAAALAESAPPSSTAAAFLIAVVAATAVRLTLGTSAGHPSSGDVVAALRELGAPVGRLEPAARQAAGVYVARAPGIDGRELLVKVYGRDAYDTQLLEKFWRTVLYQGEGLRVRLSRLEAVEHEALVTLLAAQADLPTNEVVVAAESSSGDALLVFVDSASPLGTLDPSAIDDTQALAVLECSRRACLRRDRAQPDRSGDRRGDRRRGGVRRARSRDDRSPAGSAPHGSRADARDRPRRWSVMSAPSRQRRTPSALRVSRPSCPTFSRPRSAGRCAARSMPHPWTSTISACVLPGPSAWKHPSR